MPDLIHISMSRSSHSISTNTLKILLNINLDSGLDTDDGTVARTFCFKLTNDCDLKCTHLAAILDILAVIGSSALQLEMSTGQLQKNLSYL